MKQATAISQKSNSLLSLSNIESVKDEVNENNDEKLKRKRSLSQSLIDSTKSIKRFNGLKDTNGGLQPFLLESEDPTFARTFVPCMVYLPVIRRVTQQVKINLRLKPILADESS